MTTKVNPRTTPLKSGEDADSLSPFKRQLRASRSSSRGRSCDSDDRTPASSTKSNSRKSSLKSVEDADSLTPFKERQLRSSRSSSRGVSCDSDDGNPTGAAPSSRKINSRKTPLRSVEDADPLTPFKERQLRRSSRSSSRGCDSDDRNTPSSRKTPLKSAEELHPLNERQKRFSRSQSRGKSESEGERATATPKSRKSNQRESPVDKDEATDLLSPTKESRKRSSRSSSRGKSCENEKSATIEPVTPSARRSTRISEKRAKLKSLSDSSYDGDDSCAQLMNQSDDFEYNAPAKSYFNENPDEHVHGYSFKTPKKKDGMLALAHNTPKRVIELKGRGIPHKTPTTPKGKTPRGVQTPRTPSTPKSTRKLIEPKTPHNVRAKLQKGNFVALSLCLSDPRN